MYKRIKTQLDYILKGMSRLLLVAHAAYSVVATRLAVKTFVFLYKREWTGVGELVHLEVGRQTRSNIKHFLIFNRIRHCGKCLSIDRPLHQEGQEFECDRHLVAVKA